jgi:hypothetical protein
MPMTPRPRPHLRSSTSSESPVDELRLPQRPCMAAHGALHELRMALTMRAQLPRYCALMEGLLEADIDAVAPEFGGLAALAALAAERAADVWPEVLEVLVATISVAGFHDLVAGWLEEAAVLGGGSQTAASKVKTGGAGRSPARVVRPAAWAVYGR